MVKLIDKDGKAVATASPTCSLSVTDEDAPKISCQVSASSGLGDDGDYTKVYKNEQLTLKAVLENPADGYDYKYNWGMLCKGAITTGGLAKYSRTVTVTKLKSGSASSTGSAKCLMQVVSSPEITNVQCSASPNPATVGDSVAFSASAKGGTGNFSYKWKIGTGAGYVTDTKQSGQSTAAKSGVFPVNVTITSGDKSKLCSFYVTVQPKNTNTGVKTKSK